MLTFERGPDGRTLIVDGEVDLASADRLVDAVSRMLDGSPPRLDVRKVSFLDSTGVHALIRIARMQGGDVELVAPSREVRRVLDLVGLDSGLPVRIVEEPSEGEPA